jgi:hypothetical protein
VFTRETVYDVLDIPKIAMQYKLKILAFTKKEVKEKMHSLRTEAAKGPDSIGPILLKELAGG